MRDLAQYLVPVLTAIFAIIGIIFGRDDKRTKIQVTGYIAIIGIILTTSVSIYLIYVKLLVEKQKQSYIEATSVDIGKPFDSALLAFAISEGLVQSDGAEDILFRYFFPMNDGELMAEIWFAIPDYATFHGKFYRYGDDVLQIVDGDDVIFDVNYSCHIANSEAELRDLADDSECSVTDPLSGVYWVNQLIVEASMGGISLPTDVAAGAVMSYIVQQKDGYGAIKLFGENAEFAARRLETDGPIQLKFYQRRESILGDECFGVYIAPVGISRVGGDEESITMSLDYMGKGEVYNCEANRPSI